MMGGAGRESRVRFPDPDADPQSSFSCSIPVIIQSDRKRMGMFISGYRRGKTRIVAIGIVAVELLLYALSSHPRPSTITTMPHSAASWHFRQFVIGVIREACSGSVSSSARWAPDCGGADAASTRSCTHRRGSRSRRCSTQAQEAEFALLKDDHRNQRFRHVEASRGAGGRQATSRCAKRPSDGRQRTWVRLTGKGRTAFRRHVKALETLAASCRKRRAGRTIGSMRGGSSEARLREKRSQHQRLSRARQGAATAFPVRISRRRLVRRGDAAAERRGFAVGRARAARASRRFVDRPVDRAVRQALGDAGRLGTGRAIGTLCPPRRSAGGEGRGGRPTYRSRFRRSAPARSARSRRRPRSLVPALYRQGPRLRRAHDRDGPRRRAAARWSSPSTSPSRARAIANRAGCPAVAARGRHAPGARTAGLAVGCRRPRPPDQPRQPRADCRQARAAERFPGLDPRNFDAFGQLEGRRMGARAMGRAR